MKKGAALAPLHVEARGCLGKARSFLCAPLLLPHGAMMRHGRAPPAGAAAPLSVGDLTIAKKDRILKAMQQLNDSDTQKSASGDLLAIINVRKRGVALDCMAC